MHNCTVDSFVDGWSLKYSVVNYVICVAGVIGNLTSLLCLYYCNKIDFAIKILLGAFFGTLFIVSLLTLPLFTYMNREALLCKASELPYELRVFVIIGYGSLQLYEKANSTALCVFRLVALRWPHYFRSMVRLKVIIAIEVAFIVYSLPPLLIIHIIDPQAVNSVAEEPATLNFSQIGYGIFHVIPTLVSLASNALLSYTMTRRKKQMDLNTSSKKATMDHISLAIIALVMVNLLLDIPHIISHVLRDIQVPSLIIHNFFYLHLALDPLIFVGMNPHYRKTLRHLYSFRLKKLNQEETTAELSSKVIDSRDILNQHSRNNFTDQE